jgi:hypothetical protein
MMLLKQSNYVGSTQPARFKKLIKVVIYLALGVLIGRYLDRLTGSTKPLNLASEAGQVEEVQNQSNIQLTKEVKAKREQIEKLIIQLTQTKSELSSLYEIEELRQFVTDLRIQSFEVAELAHHFSISEHVPQKLCLMTRTDRLIQSGDLIVAQGVLLGEISQIDGRCFTMIPVHSKLSSFEVKLEKSGVRGVAVGLGSSQIDHQRPSTETPTMTLKYLERSESAILGERALLVRKIHKRSQPNLKIPSFTRLPNLTVGEVISAEIDENGLFQSAFLTSPLSHSSISFVVIIPIENLIEP